ncbi:hypothetical protein E4U42_003068 [Claviceps africana]|uniref:MARVEL domain-containing protein n=1 Tax=Claviceps africana TaxID=83212 RepID=A0A8K0J7B9_9HYPO|nr:hypothetical protein E4U42_003068 [Claviceps africana]
MSRLSTAALRALQGLLAGGNLGLSAYVVNWYRTNTSKAPPNSVDFLLSASIMSMLSILYLELSPRFFDRLARPYLFLAVEGLNSILYFAGFIAIAVHIGSLAYCNTGNMCGASRGNSVVAAGAFCAWIASTILRAKRIIVESVASRSKNMPMGEV